MEIRARYVLVGLFLLAVAIGGFAFVYWLQTQGSLGKRTSYDVRFSNTVSGLLTGSPVLFNGIRVGDVTGLRLVPEEPRLVDATISINANTPVRADTLVSLEFQGLTGVAVVTLAGGSPNAPLPAATPDGIPRLVASEAAGESMSEAARRVLGRLDKILAENSNDFRNIITNISTFSEALGRNSGKVDGIVAGLDRMTGGGKGSGVFYSLNAVPAPATPAAPLGKQLAIADPTALLAYDSEKILSQGQAGQLEALGNAKWSDTVPKLIQAKMLQSFENNGSLGEVNRPIDGVTPDYQLMMEVRRFQIVPAPEAAAEAEISAKLASGDGHVVAARVFNAKEPVSSKEEAEAARALNAAFGTIATNVVRWTRDTIASAADAEHEAGEKVEDAEKKQPAGLH
ncbi:MAG: ABC-type transport auxiliary lipoprotein family protein [Rhodomicrobium sp.]